MKIVALASSNMTTETVPVTCPSCHGIGTRAGGLNPGKCALCDGLGRIRVVRVSQGDASMRKEIIVCDRCGNEGEKWRDPFEGGSDLHVVGWRTEKGQKNARDPQRINLCGLCADQFDKWMRASS